VLDKPVGAHETDSEDGRSGDRTEVPGDPRVLLTSTSVPERLDSGRCSTTRDEDHAGFPRDVSNEKA
jgi:hypothetical protein